MKQAQLSRLIPFAQPGTPAYAKLAESMAQLNDSDLGIEDFAPPAPEPMTTEEGAVEGGGAPMMSETDRPVINARLDQPEPAF